MEKWQEEGTIGFFLPEAESGWRTDYRRYDLPTLRVNRFRIALTKSEQRMLSVSVGGLVDMPVVLTTPLPAGSEPLHVTILWRAGHMQLYLEGESVAVVEIPSAGETKRIANN